VSPDMSEALELLVDRSGARVRLLSPGVGWFTETRQERSVLAEGDEAGALLVLGRAHVLRVPAGVQGRIATPRKERAHAPVGWREVLYELEPIGALADVASTGASPASASTDALVLRSPQSGRYYHRAAPGAPAFVTAGQSIADGQPVGLIEVMKTFAHVPYRAGGALPPRAKVLRVVAADGGEVRAGDVLLELAAETPA
jgi:acetyl-CoA carboxylase biotin carboxyl carrier protein